MLVAVPSIGIAEQYAALLVDSGYEHVDRRYRDLWPERIVLIRREHGSRACHAHLMLRHHRNWTRLLTFRLEPRHRPASVVSSVASVGRDVRSGPGVNVQRMRSRA